MQVAKRKKNFSARCQIISWPSKGGAKGGVIRERKRKRSKIQFNESPGGGSVKGPKGGKSIGMEKSKEEKSCKPGRFHRQFGDDLLMCEAKGVAGN